MAQGTIVDESKRYVLVVEDNLMISTVIKLTLE